MRIPGGARRRLPQLGDGLVQPLPLGQQLAEDQAGLRPLGRELTARRSARSASSSSRVATPRPPR